MQNLPRTQNLPGTQNPLGTQNPPGMQNLLATEVGVLLKGLILKIAKGPRKEEEVWALWMLSPKMKKGGLWVDLVRIQALEVVKKTSNLFNEKVGLA